MADATSATPAGRPRKRRLWLRVLGWLFGIVVVLLVALYFIATSSAFFKGTILPRVSNALHADVTVSSADISPLSQIVLRDLKIQPTNQPALVTAPEVRVRYSLLDIIGGDIRVDEIALDSPTLQIVQNADGTSNLDPLTESQKKPAEQKAAPQPGKPSKPARIDLRKLTLSNATFRKVQNHKAGTRDLLELTNVDVRIVNVKNGGSGKIEFGALIRDENNPPAPAMYGLLQAKVDGGFDFTLTSDLKPGTVLGDAHLNISQAGGSFSDFAKLAGALHCDISPSEIKTVSLKFEKSGAPLGELRAEGPYDAQKSEGRLRLELLAVDKQVLNLFGARSGIDFGSTTITSTNQIELTKSKTSIAVVGQLSASKFQLSRTNESTPPLELRADYNVSIDKTEQTALLQKLNLVGTQNGRPLLRGQLTSPMTLAWGKVTNTVGDSSFDLAVTRLNIADWRAFAGSLASAGTLDLNLKLLSQQAGKRLTFDATNQIQNLSFQLGPQHISDATVTLGARGVATDFKQFNLSDYSVQLAQSNQTALTVSGSGTYDGANTNADFQVTLDATLARLLRLLGRSDVTASSGTAELKAQVTQKQQTQTIVGNLVVNKFTGNFGRNDFRNFGVAMDLDAKNNPDQIEIRKASGTLTDGRSPGGQFDIFGTYSTNKPSQFSVKLSDFNQDGLRPFLEPLLADKKLVSVSVNGSVSAQRNPNGDSTVKSDLQVSNLVVSSPTQQLPATPLEAEVQLDAGMAKQVADIHQLQITLTPTQRAKNQFQLQGRVDMSKTNGTHGNLKLTADSLDLTSYYDLFSATNKTTVKTNGRNKPQKATAPPPAPTEAAATTNQLPFKNFVVEASVREFYLREIAATNFLASMKLDGSHIVLKPFQLTLNGSPMCVNADVDMSVPGYKYVLAFGTTNVPFAPLWNTFDPEEKGKVSGTLTAYANISGTGTSGESLQETLTGTFNAGTTNLNLDPSKIRNPVLGDIVAVVARTPELFGDNPVAAVEDSSKGFAGRVLGKYSGGLSGDVSRSPIDIITLRGNAADGRVTVEQTVVRSTVFEADIVNGTITLAPVLTNSTLNLPVSLSLNSAVAQRIPVLASLSSTGNSNYVKLPDFYVEKGSIGHPKPSISVTAVGKGVIQRLIPGLGGGTNSILNNPLNSIGGILGGNLNTNQPATNQPSTNQPATNQSPVNNLLRRFIGPGSIGK